MEAIKVAIIVRKVFLRRFGGGFFWQCSLLQKTIQLENAIFNANLIIIRMRVLQTEIFLFFFGFQKNGCLCLSDNNIHFISESGNSTYHIEYP